MKTKGLTFVAAGVLFLATFHAVTKPQREGPKDAATEPPARITDEFGLLYQNPSTFEISGPAEDKSIYAPLNTPDQIEQRRWSALAVSRSGEYLKRFPKTSKQLKEEEKSLASIFSPDEYRKQNRRTPAQLQAEEEAAWTIKHPVEAHAKWREQKEKEQRDKARKAEQEILPLQD